MSTPRTDEKSTRLYTGKFNMMEIADGFQEHANTLETELQQAQAALAHEKETSDAAVLLLKRVTAEKTELLAALAAVTLERDEAKRDLVNWKADAAYWREQWNDQTRRYDEARAQLAACQSREAKLETQLQMCRHETKYANLSAALADRDQLLAQVGVLQGALERWTMRSTRMSSQEIHELYQESRDLLNQPAPAAPDSAKDGARLEAVFAHGFIRWIADGPYKGLLMMNREMLDNAMSATPPKAP